MSVQIRLPLRKYRIISGFYKLLKQLPLGRPFCFDLITRLHYVLYRVILENCVVERYQNGFKVLESRRKFLAAEVIEGARIVEIGCGSGYNFSLIINRKVVYKGIDLDASNIMEAKKKYSLSAEFYCEDALSFLDRQRHGQKFDLIILSHVLEHLDNPETVLLSCLNLCDRVFVEVPDVDNDIILYARMAKGLDPIPSDDDHKWEFSRDFFYEFSHKHNLTILKQEYIHCIQRFVMSKRS